MQDKQWTQTFDSELADLRCHSIKNKNWGGKELRNRMQMFDYYSNVI
jgi:hypothetical protein